jgi:hypothetical protein
MTGIQAGSIGTRLVITVRDETGGLQSSLDLAEVTLRFRPPYGAPRDRSPDGIVSPGVFEYYTVDGDLDRHGVWRLQVIAETPQGRWPSGVTSFVVHPNL